MYSFEMQSHWWYSLINFQLVENSMIKLDRICREANVMLIFARSYGLTGFVRISLKVIWYIFIVQVPGILMPEEWGYVVLIFSTGVILFRYLLNERGYLKNVIKKRRKVKDGIATDYNFLF